MAGKTSLKMMKKKQEEVKAATSGDFFKADVGENLIRILPPWKGVLPFLEIHKHTAQKKGQDKAKSYTCPLSRGEDFCYTCEVVIPELEEGDAEDRAIADQLTAKRRVVANILHRATDGKPHPENKALIWEFSFFSKGNIYNILLGLFSDSDYGDITDPKEGFDLVYTREGTGFKDTKYSIRPKRNPTEIPKAILSQLHDLDEMFKAASSQDQKEILEEFYGLTFDDPEETESSSDDPPWDDAEQDDAEQDDGEEESDAGEDEEESGSDSEDSESEDSESEDPDPEEESGEDDQAEDGERTPIKLKRGLKGMAKKKALDAAEKKSKCFGKLFDEDADECESCAGMINCVVATEEEGEEEEEEKPAPKKKTTRKRTTRTRRTSKK